MPLPTKNVAWPPTELGQVAPALERFGAWYAGDPEQLQSAYQHAPRVVLDRPAQYRGGVQGTLARTFWGAPVGDLTAQPKRKLHVPLAADICQASADLLFSEPPTFTVGDDTSQARLDELVDDGMLSTFAEAAELAAALGGTYLRVAWDKAVRPDAPFITAVDADGAWPEFRWGILTAVTFWTVVETRNSGSVYVRHLERHETNTQGLGVVLHGLYEGNKDNLGRAVPLTEAKVTAALADVVTQGNLISTESPGLAVIYVPNQRPQRLWRHDLIGRHLGRSDLDGVEGLMDSLDETYTSWMRDIRLGKARVFLSESLLEGFGPGLGAGWDLDREVYAPLARGVGSFNPGGGNAASPVVMHAEQFAIRFAEHDATANALIGNIVRTAGYSVQTFGESGTTAMTATENVSREKRSYMTRDRKIRHWRPALGDVLEKLLAVDKALFGGRGAGRPEVIFGDGVQDSQLVLAQTAQALDVARAASTETKVAMIHPDWDDAQVQEEVTRIHGEDTINVPNPFTALPPGAVPGGPNVPPPPPKGQVPPQLAPSAAAAVRAAGAGKP